MDNKTGSKRRKDKHSDNEDDRRETKIPRRRRTRSRSKENRDKDSRRKRRYSRSRSPNPMKQEKRREDASNDANTKKNVPERKAKETDMLNTRTGGAYIPPARLRMMQAQITDKSSAAYQRLAWEALKKSIHGHINKINVGNIGIIIKELLKENIVRGRGLLCRSVIQAQAASPTFTNVYAALVAAVNSRFPNIGELLLKRLVIQFKRGFKRNDKPTCISSASFIAHLVNQRVAHEILALELLTLLVESPTDDSVEVAIAFLKECGQKLTEVSTKGVNAIFEMLRNILHEGQLDKRVQYMIEVMFQVWKDGFKDHPALIEELELVPEEEQFTHLLMLDDATDPQDILNVFKFDDKYEENEQKYKTLSKEILGSDAESGDEEGSEESGSGESEDEEVQEGEQKGMTIIDNTETNLVALRRTIYLTINSSLDFEECAHKLMKMQLKPGQEVELCHMFLDCCAEQRTYEKFYGLLAQRFCNINRIYIGPFEEIFKDSYSTAHRLDTNRLRNVSKFFAHLLFTDSISWEVMECVKLNEEDTTSSSRIYIKILFQELAEYMGLKKLNDRLKDPTLQDAFSGIFPRDNPKNTRFSINFFTSIGLGGLTDELREHLKQMPKNIPAPVTDINVESESSDSSSSSSSDSSSDSSSSDSEDENESNKKKSKKSTDKSKSKENNDEVEETNKDKNDKVQRWGHDGFYETYGENARRHRPERSEHNNFPRPRDRERHGEDENRSERNNRDMNGSHKDRTTKESDESRGPRMDSDDRRQERGRPYDKRRDNNSTNERNVQVDRRYDNNVRGRSDREERMRDQDFGSQRDTRGDDKRQDRYQRRDRDHVSNRDDSERDKRDNAREKNNRDRLGDRNTDDDRNRVRNSEREKKDKYQERNEIEREGDRYKGDDRSREHNSEREREKKDKCQERNETDREVDRNKGEDRYRERNSEREKKDKCQERNETDRGSDRNKGEDRYRERNSEREKKEKCQERNETDREGDRNKGEDRYRERNSEREKKDKWQERNYTDRESDRYRGDDRNRERNSEKDRREKGNDRYERARDGDQNKKDERIRDYNSERENRNKLRDRNDRLREDDRNRNNKIEDKMNKVEKRREEKSNAIDIKDKNGKNTKIKDKGSDSSSEEDSRQRQKEKKKSRKTDVEMGTPEPQEKQKSKKSKKKDKKERKKTSKKTKRNKKDTDSSSSESSSDDSSSSESEIEQTGGRYWDSFDIEKPVNRGTQEFDRTPELKEKRRER